MNPIVLLDGNARPHKGGSWNNGVSVPPYCTYSPDVTFTDLHLDGPMWNAIRRRIFAVDDDLKHSVREELRWFSKCFYAQGLYLLTKKYQNCADNGEFVEKQSQICKGCAHELCKFYYNCY